MEQLNIIWLVILSAAGFWAGYRHAAKTGKAWMNVIAALCALCIIAIRLLRFYPVAGFHYIPAFMSSFADTVSFFPFAMVIFGLGLKTARTRRLALEIKFAAALIFAYSLLHASWVLCGVFIDDNKFRIDADGVCLQSTGYTCGPASAVTFLKAYGIDATEQEMTRLSHANLLLGVDFGFLGKAVEKKAASAGMTIDVIAADYEFLKKHGKPCIVYVRWHFLVDHVIVVLHADENKVIFADPLDGKREWSRQEFLDRWGGEAIAETSL